MFSIRSLIMGGLFLASQAVFTTQAAATTCHAAVQGNIAWNYQGSTAWNPANVNRLCGAGHSTAPAQCFQHVMHGGVNWGGGTQWKWENAIDLCESAYDAAYQVQCFEGKIAMGYPWQTAIAYCDERSYGPQACPMAVQGKIAWNYQGTTAWNPTNVSRLCAGVPSPEPAACFQHVMHAGVNWGGGTQWKWENAIDLCEGSRNAAMTVSCFNAQMSAHGDWPTAIRQCSY